MTILPLKVIFFFSSKFHSTCYFKSTDGHTNNWSFNASHLNLHVPLLAGEKGGCMIVDSTRRGKRFPDSMSKTILIWTCVLNRFVTNFPYKACHSGDDLVNIRVDCLVDWDCSLHLPLWVSDIEKAAINERVKGWVKELEASGADIAALSSCLKKNLRPLWISQRTVIWLNEVPDHDAWDFTPIILVSASSQSGAPQRRTNSEFSWNYIAGAGDDEESWARGLSPTLFWKHVYDLINSRPNLCNQMVRVHLPVFTSQFRIVSLKKPEMMRLDWVEVDVEDVVGVATEDLKTFERDACVPNANSAVVGGRANVV